MLSQGLLTLVTCHIVLKDLSAGTMVNGKARELTGPVPLEA